MAVHNDDLGQEN